MLFKQHQQHTYHSLEGSTTHQPLMSNSTDRMLSGLDVGNPLVQTNMNINQVIHNSAVVDVKENETGTLNGTVNAPRSRTPSDDSLYSDGNRGSGAFQGHGHGHGDDEEFEIGKAFYLSSIHYGTLVMMVMVMMVMVMMMSILTSASLLPALSIHIFLTFHLLHLAFLISLYPYSIIII
jgi:hypothetical protein